jgi:hypothetical protein
MSTVEFITALFYEVDEQLGAIPKHPEAHHWPSEVGTLGLLHALKGVGNRAFYRWLTRDYRPLFPRLPERTRLFRLFNPTTSSTLDPLIFPAYAASTGRDHHPQEAEDVTGISNGRRGVCHPQV